MKVPVTTQINTENVETERNLLLPPSLRLPKLEPKSGYNPVGISARVLQVTTIGQTSLGLANNDQHQAESRLLATELAASQTDPFVTGNKEIASDISNLREASAILAQCAALRMSVEGAAGRSEVDFEQLNLPEIVCQHMPCL